MLNVRATKKLRQRLGSAVPHVTVRKIDLRNDGTVAICERGQDWQAIGVFDLPLPDPAPADARWARLPALET